MKRPLTKRERDILDLLLSLEAPGVAELREQARTAEAVDTCPCGCATIDLEVDRDASPRSLIPHPHGPAIEATTRALAMSSKAGAPPTAAEEQRGTLFYKVVLWVDEDGWLSSIEIIDLILDDPGDANPFPPPEEFYSPRLHNVLPPPKLRRRRFRPWRRSRESGP